MIDVRCTVQNKTKALAEEKEGTEKIEQNDIVLRCTKGEKRKREKKRKVTSGKREENKREIAGLDK